MTSDQRQAAGDPNERDRLIAQFSKSLRPQFLQLMYGNPELANQQLDFYARLASAVNGKRFQWMSLARFESLATTDFRRASEIYWKEMLYRAYLSAALALLRSNTWLQGALAGCDSENLHVIASCLRGLLESAADINSTFKRVHLTIATSYHHIREAVRGKAKTLSLNEELENELIHFTHARRLGKNDSAPRAHRALTVKDYFERMSPDLNEQCAKAYEDLCAISHPSFASTACFVRASSGDMYDTTVVQATDSLLRAAALLYEHREAFQTAIHLSFNHSAITLKLLDTFPVTELKTPMIRRVDLSAIEAWVKVRDTLRAAGVAERPA